MNRKALLFLLLTRAASGTAGTESNAPTALAGKAETATVKNTRKGEDTHD